ncbi:hypothetical protein T06_10232 [Trichinella sp. T6]|nr:hypothetical protein T06_10232 [Trichinella sp. T6]
MLVRKGSFLEIPDQRIIRFSAHDKWTQVIVRTNAKFIFPEEQLVACEMKWNFSKLRNNNKLLYNCSTAETADFSIKKLSVPTVLIFIRDWNPEQIRSS